MRDAVGLRHAMSLEAETDYDVRSPGWHDRFVAYFRERARDGVAQVLIARSAGEPVGIGMTIAAILDHYRGPVYGTQMGYVYSVYVRPAWRGRGIAGELLRRSAAWLRERGCRALRLRTNASERPMYEHLGFVPTSEMELRLIDDPQ